MKKLFGLFLGLLILTACGEMPQGKPNSKSLTLSDVILEQRGKTSKDYDMEFELLHAHFYTALLQEEKLTVVLAADGCTNSLGDNSPIHRLEGRLDVMMNGMDEEMTLQDFTAALPHKAKEAFSAVEISAGTAYYVSDEGQPYTVVRFDSDGNGLYDIRMDIVIDEEQTVKPSAHAWLCFEEETN